MARRWHPGAKDDIGVFPKGSGTGQDPVRDEDVDPTAEALIPEALTALCPSARAVCRGGVSPRTPAQGSGSGALSRPPASPAPLHHPPCACCSFSQLVECGAEHSTPHPRRQPLPPLSSVGVCSELSTPVTSVILPAPQPPQGELGLPRLPLLKALSKGGSNGTSNYFKIKVFLCECLKILNGSLCCRECSDSGLGASGAVGTPGTAVLSQCHGSSGVLGVLNAWM